MGFRMRKSFRVAKGVRLNVSKSGIGVSAGVRGARVSLHSSGRRTTTVGIPGSGLSYVSTSGGGKRRSAGSARQVPIAETPAPIKPGLFAPKGEKELYKAIKDGAPVETIEQIANTYPTFRNAALAFAAVKRIQADQADSKALSILGELFANGYDPASDAFSSKYLSPVLSLSVSIPSYPVARLPFSRALLAVAYAGGLFKTGRNDKALNLADYIKDTVAGQILLVELYDESGYTKQALSVTDNLNNDDEASMLLLVLRGKALAKLGYLDAALEAFKEALRYRSRPDQLKMFAWFNRAQAYANAGKFTQARKDAERVMAEDFGYDGIQDLMAQINGEKPKAAAKATPKASASQPTSTASYPKLKGEIGYYNLEDWWFTTFTDTEQKYIIDKFQPMGMGVGEDPEKNSLTEGDISWSSASVSNFLNSLSSWFTGPNDRVIGRKIGEKAKEEALKSKDPLDMHFALSSLITLYYRDRDQADYYDKALAYCRAQIKIQAVAAKAFLKEYPKQPLPSHVGYEQLAIVLEKEKKYQEAIDLSKEAKVNGWAGDWNKRIDRCQKKISS